MSSLNLTEEALVEAYVNSLESCNMMLELSFSSPCASLCQKFRQNNRLPPSPAYYRSRSVIVNYFPFL